MDAIRLSIGVCLMLAGLAWGVLRVLDDEEMDLMVVGLLFAGAILIAGGDA